MAITTKDVLKKYSPDQIRELAADWTGKYLPKPIAREKQLLPSGDWLTWLINAGRGYGKTRTGAETIRIWAEDNEIIHLVGATAADVRDTMVEGPSGLLNVFPQHKRPVYHKSKRKVEFKNGAYALLFSAEEPDRLRGPQCYKAWADELAAWKYPDAWDQLLFGLRLGDMPQVIVTTTPRPTKLIKELIKDSSTYITTGSTYENKANLSKKALEIYEKKYAGTTLGRQELFAEVLEDIKGALWTNKMIEATRQEQYPELDRLVVAFDPAGSGRNEADETGIIAAGKAGEKGYILADESGRYSPQEAAERAIKLYHELKADAVVIEKNYGGDWIPSYFKKIDPSVRTKTVTATRGKKARAEPVAGMYEQSRISHVGFLPKLEDEMTTWVYSEGMPSPNRVDALVWGLTDLFIKPERKFLIG